MLSKNCEVHQREQEQYLDGSFARLNQEGATAHLHGRPFVARFGPKPNLQAQLVVVKREKRIAERKVVKKREPSSINNEFIFEIIRKVVRAESG